MSARIARVFAVTIKRVMVMKFIIAFSTPVCLLLACYTTALSSSPPQWQDVSFRAKNPADITALLSAPADVPEIELKGYLKLPPKVKGKIPAVIVLHGSGGLQRGYRYYADQLVKNGMAVLLVDSHKSRGVVKTSTDKTRILVSYGAMVGDAYGALQFLADHPAIDPDRIAPMGFSKGGVVALYSADQKTSRVLAPKGLGFSGFVAVYPLCMTPFKNPEPVRAPILIPIGEADDLTPAHWCQKYVDRIKKAGAYVELILYPGAHHAFIFPMPNKIWYAGIVNPSNCYNEILDNGRFTIPNSDETLSENEWRVSYVTKCRTFGATIGGGTPQLRKKFFQDLKQFLQTNFSLQ